MDTYVTNAGDTWDMIAKSAYGSEFYAGYLMSNNYSLLEHCIFPAGIVLNTPELKEDQDIDTPPWRD